MRHAAKPERSGCETLGGMVVGGSMESRSCGEAPAGFRGAALPRRCPRSAAFTLVEIIGALSVMTILAALLVPRIFQVIDDARYSTTSSGCNTVRAAVNEYYGRYGRLGGADGSDLGLVVAGSIYEDWDSRCLVPAGFLDRAFDAGIGNRQVGHLAGGSRVRVINIRGNDANTPVAASEAALERGAYDRNGAGNTNDVLGSWVVEACIEGVANHEAIALNDRLDGEVMGADLGQNDQAGRVKYLLGTNGLARVRVYLSHR